MIFVSKTAFILAKRVKPWDIITN